MSSVLTTCWLSTSLVSGYQPSHVCFAGVAFSFVRILNLFSLRSFATKNLYEKQLVKCRISLVKYKWRKGYDPTKFVGCSSERNLVAKEILLKFWYAETCYKNAE